MIGAVIYAFPALQSEYVTWDDTKLIVENDRTQGLSLASIRRAFTSYDPELYIPLTFLSYQLQAEVCGTGSLCAHVFNLVLHVMCAFLLFLLLERILGHRHISLFLGLLFLAHPLNTETVMWASARKDSLSTFLYLSSLFLYISYCDKKSVSFLAFSLLLFFLALLSKVMVVTLPAALVLVDVLLRREITREAILEKIPFFALGIIFGVIAYFGKTEVLLESSLLEKVLMSGKSTAFYLSKFIFPYPLSVMYPETQTISMLTVSFAVSWIIVTALALITAKYSREVFIALLLFGFSLLPTFTNFAKGGHVYFASDRYAYLPMLWLLLATGYLLKGILPRLSGQVRRAAPLLWVFLILSYGLESHAQAQTWLTSKALYENVLRHYPKAIAARNNYGMELLASGQASEAVKEFDRALSEKEDALIRANRASALLLDGRAAESADEFQRIILEAPALPDGYYGLALIAQRSGNLEVARKGYELALTQNPLHANSLNNLGTVYLLQEKYLLAVDIFKRLIDAKQNFAPAHYNLGGAYEMLGEFGSARAQYRRALDLSPLNADAEAGLARVEKQLGE